MAARDEGYADMSYDYWLMRARHPIRGGADVDEPNVAAIGTLQEIKSLVQKARPDFAWNEKDQYWWFKDESANVRLHVGFGEPGPQFLVITVKAWWRERFHEQLVALATSLGLFAFDPQQGRVVGGVAEPPS